MRGPARLTGRAPPHHFAKNTQTTPRHAVALLFCGKYALSRAPRATPPFRGGRAHAEWVGRSLRPAALRPAAPGQATCPAAQPDDQAHWKL